MRRSCLLVLAVCAAAMLDLLPISAQSSQQPTEADFAWVARVQKQALDALMPLELRSRQIVAYRTDHDLQRIGEIEGHFTISYAAELGYNPNDFSASVVTPIGRSIQRQLLDLHMADRTATFEVIVAKVGVRRLTLESSRCPAVRQRIDALSDVAITFPFRDRTVFRIFLHPVSHRLVIRSGSLTLDAEDLDQESSLVRWALQSSDDLTACGREQ